MDKLIYTKLSFLKIFKFLYYIMFVLGHEK
jgi:hypothetical protein